MIIVVLLISLIGWLQIALNCYEYDSMIMDALDEELDLFNRIQASGNINQINISIGTSVDSNSKYNNIYRTLGENEISKPLEAISVSSIPSRSEIAGTVKPNGPHLDEDIRVTSVYPNMVTSTIHDGMAHQVYVQEFTEPPEMHVSWSIM